MGFDLFSFFRTASSPPDTRRSDGASSQHLVGDLRHGTGAFAT